VSCLLLFVATFFPAVALLSLQAELGLNCLLIIQHNLCAVPPAMAISPHFLSVSSLSFLCLSFVAFYVCLSIKRCLAQEQNAVPHDADLLACRSVNIWLASCIRPQQSHLSLEFKLPAGQLITYMKRVAVGLRRAREVRREMAISQATPLGETNEGADKQSRAASAALCLRRNFPEAFLNSRIVDPCWT
jgi:hypothetical protein